MKAGAFELQAVITVSDPGPFGLNPFTCIGRDGLAQDRDGFSVIMLLAISSVGAIAEPGASTILPLPPEDAVTAFPDIVELSINPEREI